MTEVQHCTDILLYVIVFKTFKRRQGNKYGLMLTSIIFCVITFTRTLFFHVNSNNKYHYLLT